MSTVPPVPAARLRVLRDDAPRPKGEFVLYWMTAARRTRWSHALDRALSVCREHGRGLLVLEALRCDYPHASERIHRFVLDGMADNARRFAASGVAYHPYVEPSRGAGRGLLAALAARAVAVIADDTPSFFLPRMLEAAAGRVSSRLEAVDGNGLLPLSSTDRPHPTAYAFRRHFQRSLPACTGGFPAAEPLRAAEGLPGVRIPADVARRWPAAPTELLEGRRSLAALPVDHSVSPTRLRGGPSAGSRVLDRFLEERLEGYASGRNDPARGAGSGLSAYLHFGHVGAHQVFRGVLRAQGLREPPAPGRATGAREGWWGLAPGAEAFLDQVVVWRELGFHFARHRPDHADYGSLPEWARRTLDAHRSDARDPVHSPGQFEAAGTGDEVWNAAQRELLRHGRIHNYLRMLWGKKVLHWSASPEEALSTLFRLNDRYALDGRDPNSSTGIAWCLGRFDRPWGPERPVFGTVRYMSTESTRRKFRMDDYLQAHGPEEGTS